MCGLENKNVTVGIRTKGSEIMTREERIQQIKYCGQSIIDNAESIYGNFEYPASLEIVVSMPIKEFPIITVKRDFNSEIMVNKKR